MKRIPIVSTVLVSAAVGLAAAPAAAGGIKTVTGGEVDATQLAWRQISGAQTGPTELLGMVRTPDGALRIAIPHDGDLAQSLVFPDGNAWIIPDPPIASEWVSLTSPAFTSAPGGTLRAFFGGRHTNDNQDPNRDLNAATSADGGRSWHIQAGPVTARPNGSDYAYTAPITAVAAGPDLHPLEAWAGGAGLFVHAGMTPATPDYEYPQTGAAGQAAITPRLATTPNGAVALAWVTGRPAGVHVQRVNANTGAPAGPPVDFPDLVTSTGLNSMFERTPLVGRAVFGGFFSAYRGGGAARDTVRVWGVGQRHSTEFLGRRRGVSVSDVALDSDVRGHLWLAYVINDNGKLLLSTERSDAKSAKVALFGSRVVATLPYDAGNVIDLEVSAQPDRLDVLATQQLSNGTYQTYSAQSLPGLTLTSHISSAPAGPARTVMFRVTDAGVPVSGATISFLGHTVKTGHDGSAALRTSAQRAATATASHAGYANATRRVSL